MGMEWSQHATCESDFNQPVNLEVETEERVIADENKKKG